MSKHLQQSFGGISRAVLGTMAVSVLSLLCVAGHLATAGVANGVPARAGGAVPCPCGAENA